MIFMVNEGYVKRFFDPSRPARVADYYVNQHLTMREIGLLEGISGVAVWKILHKQEISAADGERVSLTCPECGKAFTRTRARVRKTRVPRCSVGCYRAARRKPTFVGWRQGMRRARAEVMRAGFPLTSAHVVHHVDGNQRNNDRRNLWVFGSQGDHVKHHHGKRVEPLWRGDAGL